MTNFPLCSENEPQAASESVSFGFVVPVAIGYGSFGSVVEDVTVVLIQDPEVFEAVEGRYVAVLGAEIEVEAHEAGHGEVPGHAGDGSRIAEADLLEGQRKAGAAPLRPGGHRARLQAIAAF